MKRLNQFMLISLAVVITAAMGMAGCATTGMERSTKATTSMTEMDRNIKLLLVQLDATGASLRELVKPDNPDVEKAFQLFTENVSTMEQMEKSFAKHTNEMNASGKDYFEEWQKEGDKYKNPRIQRLSEQRRLELSRIYGEIATNSIGVKEELNSHVSDLKEIQHYLSNDLTPKGIKAIEPLAREVAGNRSGLKYEIKDLQAAVNKANAAMAQ
ncbi:MAG: DUF2959 family protein [Desulfobacteraceae bacterium]|nr:DUF2959 family protein [Desulfobacteraceae bacterium]